MIVMLQCTNQECLESGNNQPHRRLWNRGLVGMSDFWHITNGLREDRDIPERFRRARRDDCLSDDSTTEDQHLKIPRLLDPAAQGQRDRACLPRQQVTRPIDLSLNRKNKQVSILPIVLKELFQVGYRQLPRRCWSRR